MCFGWKFKLGAFGGTPCWVKNTGLGLDGCPSISITVWERSWSEWESAARKWWALGALVGQVGGHASRNPRTSADLKCSWTSCEDRDSFPHESTSLLWEDSGSWSLCLCVAHGRSETGDPRGFWKLLYLNALSRLEQLLPCLVQYWVSSHISSM